MITAVQLTKDCTLPLLWHNPCSALFHELGLQTASSGVARCPIVLQCRQTDFPDLQCLQVLDNLSVSIVTSAAFTCGKIRIFSSIHRGVGFESETLESPDRRHLYSQQKSMAKHMLDNLRIMYVGWCHNHWYLNQYWYAFYVKYNLSSWESSSSLSSSPIVSSLPTNGIHVAASVKYFLKLDTTDAESTPTVSAFSLVFSFPLRSVFGYFKFRWVSLLSNGAKEAEELSVERVSPGQGLSCRQSEVEPKVKTIEGGVIEWRWTGIFRCFPS